MASEIDDLPAPSGAPAPAHRVSTQMLDFTYADVQEHLSYVFSGTHGWVFFATLDRSEVRPVPRGKAFQWPQDHGKIVEWIAEAIQKPWTEVFYCPYPMKSRKVGDKSGRAAGNSSSRWVMHADIDRPLPASVQRQLRAWGFRFIASGTPGHVQVLARLSRPVTLAEHRGLAVALRSFVGGDDKISDNDYLKLPGGFNHKHHPSVPDHKRNDRKYPVRVVWMGKPKVNPDKLIAELKAHPIEAETAVEPPAHWTRTKVIVGKLPPHLQNHVYMQVDDIEDRSSACHAAVLAFADAGHSRDEIHTVLDMFEPGVDKFGDRWHGEIDRILGKRRGLTEVGEGFWERRPVLEHIRDCAWAGLASPWATLGVVLAEVLQGVPPHVMLPRMAGGIQSLNYFVLLEGASSAGKGTATAAARAAFNFGRVTKRVAIGSGEGISKVFKRRAIKGETGEFVWKTRAALLDVPELGTLRALMARPENTLTAELCKAWSGESLGFQNSDESKTVPVEENSYRMSLLIGAQPGACESLFRTGGVLGLPQRLVYLPTIDPDAPDDPPAMPDAMAVEMPYFGEGEPLLVTFPQTVWQETRARGIKRLKGQLKEDPLDGHAMLARMKTAVGMALLEGRIEVSDEDWELAGVVMSVSMKTRRAIQEHLRGIDVRADVHAGTRSARRKLAETKAIEQDQFDQTARRVMAVVDKQHEKGLAWTGNIAAKMPRYDAAEVRRVVARLVRKGVLEMRAKGSGHQYRNPGYRQTVE